jgi:16S rRNA (uracil1498-N3)-methyltransferase
MRRFHIEDNNIIDDSIIINGDKARHIVNVLRLGVNDNIFLFDNEGTTYNGIIVDKEKESIKVKIVDKKIVREDDKKEIILGQAITKGKKMDFILQKCTELGISSIIPFFSERSIPRWDSIKSMNKVLHWKKIVAASVEQSGIRKMPLVNDMLNLSDLIIKNKFHGFLKLIFWEGEFELGLKKIFSSVSIPEKIIFIVGPEGGFSENEVLLAKKNGFIPVGLGNFTLRAETASIAVLSIIRYEQGRLG